MVPQTPQSQPSSAATFPDPAGAHLIVWKVRFPKYITA